MIILVFLGLICSLLFFVAIESSPTKKDNGYVDWTVIFGDDEDE